MQKKLSFVAIVSLVIGSQIGSGVFLLPSSLAALGPTSLFGWFISGIGAIFLALVFAKLSMILPKGGGPHVYVEQAFGRTAAFYTAWTYWLVSWVSSIAVIVAAVGYLTPLVGISHPLAIFALESSIIIAITLVNLRGATAAGSFECLLTLFKCTPLIIIPLAALFCLKPEYFQPLVPESGDLMGTLKTASLMTFWGFIGLESATVASNLVENPTKTIPRALLIGTTLVALIYFLNSFGVMGVVHPSMLAQSKAPYVDAANVIFGHGWDLVIAIIAFIACIGTLNAWVLTSGQIAAEAAKEGLFPSFFAKRNRFGAPHASLLISLFCTIPLLLFTLTPNILKQLNQIIDISVITFLFIYLFCTIALLKVLKKQTSLLYGAATLVAGGFCLWVLSSITWNSFMIAALFTLSGVPIHLWKNSRAKISRPEEKQHT